MLYSGVVVTGSITSDLEKLSLRRTHNNGSDPEVLYITYGSVLWDDAKSYASVAIAIMRLVSHTPN